MTTFFEVSRSINELRQRLDGLLGRLRKLTAPARYSAEIVTQGSINTPTVVRIRQESGPTQPSLRVRICNNGTLAAATNAQIAPTLGSVVRETHTSGKDLTISEVRDTAAALETALTGTNNDLVFAAKATGPGGNGISVRYVNPNANSAALGVTVATNAITVNLATDSEGAITSTAAQIKTAIEASTPANALVSVANAAANNGSGVVTALAATNLSGGVSAQAKTFLVAVTNGTAETTTLRHGQPLIGQIAANHEAPIQIAHA
jgi:hypothetical protein